MQIETYSEKYQDDVARLVKAFHEESVGEYDEQIDPEAVIETIKTADHSNAFCLIVDGACKGLVYGTKLRSAFNGQTIFQEVMWYVDKSYRGQGVIFLLEVARILKKQGVTVMIMAVLENSKTDQLKRLYENLGFKKMETHYFRSLTNGLG